MMRVSVREYSSDAPPGDEPPNDTDSSLLKDSPPESSPRRVVEYWIDPSTSSSSSWFHHHHHDHKNKVLRLPSLIPIAVGFSSRISHVLIELFLPLGYPHSVDPSYLPYQLYDGLQGLCSYWRGVVTTRAVLEAAGVGDAHATAASAALQWAMRDGMGMFVGGLGFSYLASAYFDTHVKEFRLLADVLNDVGLTLDMIAPHVPDPTGRLIVLSLSTIGKTMCGVSAGATKGRITQHFSRQGNMADLSAKESTQETLVSLLGMMGGMWMANRLQHVSYSFTWILFGLLTVLHVWANYKAVKLLKLATLNPERTHEVMKDVVAALQKPQGGDQEVTDALERIPTPQQINESLAQSTMTLLFPPVHVNPSSINGQHFVYADLFSDVKYIIGIMTTGNHVVVHLSLGATLEDELIAYLHGLIVRAMLKDGTTTYNNHRDLMKR